jgi:uncharacterized membrane protein YphA (DoxX/SURF4 family)
MWGFISFVVFSTVIAASVFRVFERALDPVLFSLKRYALPVVRITLGLCLLALASMGTIYGSELPLTAVFGSFTDIGRIILAGVGLMIALGVYTRLMGALVLALYVYSAIPFGSYILTYTDYLGAALVVTLLGGGAFSLDNMLRINGPQMLHNFVRPLSPYAFAMLRMCFGWGVLWASVYAKFIHSQLALDVVTQYDLTRFFPFDPLFVVLGALIIEFIAGLLVLSGVALRWTLLFLAFWLTLSLLYFQELIWPHGILFGLAIALFLHGYDRYSLEGFFFKKKRHEPVF